MLKKCAVFALTIALTTISFQPVSAISQQAKQIPSVDKVRKKVAQLGIGKDKPVRVKLRSQAKLLGYISNAGEDNFTLTNAKTGANTTISYDEVLSIKSDERPTYKQFAIGGGIAAGVLLIVAFVVTHPRT